MTHDSGNGWPGDSGMPKMQLAQAYFLFQKFDRVFPCDQALFEGTVFSEFLSTGKRVDPSDEERVEEYE